MIKPQDLVVTIKLLESEGAEIPPTYASLANALRLSPSEAHAAVGRGLEAGLLRKPFPRGRAMPRPVLTAVEEFLVHGMKYVWPAKRGPVTRGIATGTSLPEVSQLLEVPDPTVPLVWAHPEGAVRGESIEPLYSRAVEACADDPTLHQWLALIDILRLRTGREAALAAAEIEHRLT